MMIQGKELTFPLALNLAAMPLQLSEVLVNVFLGVGREPLLFGILVPVLHCEILLDDSSIRRGTLDG